MRLETPGPFPTETPRPRRVVAAAVAAFVARRVAPLARYTLVAHVVPVTPVGSPRLPLQGLAGAVTVVGLVTSFAANTVLCLSEKARLVRPPQTRPPALPPTCLGPMAAAPLRGMDGTGVALLVATAGRGVIPAGPPPVSGRKGLAAVTRPLLAVRVKRLTRRPAASLGTRAVARLCPDTLKARLVRPRPTCPTLPPFYSSKPFCFVRLS